jgi:FtsH-binding integral membrane protein
MSAESLSLVAGTILSLTFSYIPGARRWFEEFEPEIKRLIMLALLLITGGVVYGLSCMGWASEWGISMSCDRSGLIGLIEQVVIAIVANQSVYAISPRLFENFSPSSPFSSESNHSAQ